MLRVVTSLSLLVWNASILFFLPTNLSGADVVPSTSSEMSKSAEEAADSNAEVAQPVRESGRTTEAIDAEDQDLESMVPSHDAIAPADEELLAEALDWSQSELRKRSQYSLGLGLGSVFAWQDLGLVMLKPISDADAWGLSLGQGNFDLNENNKAQTFLMEAKVLSLYGFYRRYISDFPIFWQLSNGLAYWAGSIRPRGNDQENLDERLSLISDFATISYNLSFSVRVSWHWDNGLFIEFAPLQFAASYILQEDYTNNAAIARDTLRDQIEGPQSWSGVNLLIGYRF